MKSIWCMGRGVTNLRTHWRGRETSLRIKDQFCAPPPQPRWADTCVPHSPLLLRMGPIIQPTPCYRGPSKAAPAPTHSASSPSRDWHHSPLQRDSCPGQSGREPHPPAHLLSPQTSLTDGRGGQASGLTAGLPSNENLCGGRWW